MLALLFRVAQLTILACLVLAAKPGRASEMDDGALLAFRLTYFEKVGRLAYLPDVVFKALTSTLDGERMAEAGSDWNPTCVVGRGQLPRRRFIFAGRSSSLWFVYFEQGGRVLHRRLVTLRRAPDGTYGLGGEWLVNESAATVAALQLTVQAWDQVPWTSASQASARSPGTTREASGVVNLSTRPDRAHGPAQGGTEGGRITRAKDALPGDPLVCVNAGGSVTVSKGNHAFVRYADGGTAETMLPAGPSPEKHTTVERLWCELTQREALLIYEVRLVDDKGDHVRGVVARLDQNGKAIWVQVLAGNVGEPYAVGGSLYVSGLGFVGKLDLHTGSYEWKHAELYRAPGMFNSFEAPRMDGHRVVFKARHANFGKPPPTSWPDAIVIDDASGAILDGGGGGPP